MTSVSFKLKFQQELTVELEMCWEECMTTFGKAAGIKTNKRSRARKEASAKEVRGYYEQFAESKHLEDTNPGLILKFSILLI